MNNDFAGHLHSGERGDGDTEVKIVTGTGFISLILAISSIYLCDIKRKMQKMKLPKLLMAACLSGLLYFLCTKYFSCSENRQSIKFLMGELEEQIKENRIMENYMEILENQLLAVENEIKMKKKKIQMIQHEMKQLLMTVTTNLQDLDEMDYQMDFLVPYSWEE